MDNNFVFVKPISSNNGITSGTIIEAPSNLPNLFGQNVTYNSYNVNFNSFINGVQCEAVKYSNIIGVLNLNEVVTNNNNQLNESVDCVIECPVLQAKETITL